MNTLKNKLSLIVPALLVIAAGVLLLTYYTGLLPYEAKEIIFSWQTLLIVIGLCIVVLNPHTHHGGGVVMMIVGVVFLLPKIPMPGFLPFERNGMALCWALLLILLGIYFLCKALFGKPHNHVRHHGCTHTRIHKGELGYIERNYVFGGGEEVIDSVEFKGGDINCVFGGMELDLSRAQLAPGTQTLEINTVFGGVTVYVPAHWRVEVRPNCVCGSFEDKRRNTSVDVEDNRTLIIAVSAVFGGGEIRNR